MARRQWTEIEMIEITRDTKGVSEWIENVQSARDISRALASAMGTQLAVDDCPIANMLKTLLPEGYHVHVDNAYVHVSRDVSGYHYPINVGTFHMGLALIAFVQAFDAGRLPNRIG